MLHTRWFGVWSTPESTTVTDSWLPVRQSEVPAREVTVRPPCRRQTRSCSSHIVHLFLTLCDGSCTGSKCQIASEWFKLCTLVYRCQHRLAPRYLSDLCSPATVYVHLRSSVTLERSLSNPTNRRTKIKTIGPRGFYFASPAAWNALPVHLRDPELSWNSFKNKIENPRFILISTWVTLIMLLLFVVRANAIIYKLARANVCFELNWMWMTRRYSCWKIYTR